MNNVSKKFCLVLASAAFVFAGCSKKPIRPAPRDTVLGRDGGTGTLSPIDLNTPPDLTVRTTGIDNGTTIRDLFQPVYFDFNESSIKAPERAKLQEAKAYLEKNPGTRLLLEGHCDWRGTAEYNLGLGDRRANAAKKYLITIGVAADRLEANSKGSLEAKPNASESEAAHDRRVDLVIIKATAS